MPPKISKTWRIICLLTLMIGGAYAPSVFSKELPQWAQDQHHYASILNPIAAQVMNWAGQNQLKNKTTITLTDADLERVQEGHFRFNLNTTHASKRLKLNKQTRFEFQSGLHNMPLLQSIDSQVVKQFDLPNIPSITNQNTHLYYRARELAYWWLAHLDGNDKAHQQGALEPWINTAIFQSERHQNAQKETSTMHPELPQSGGHLLRTIKIEPYQNDSKKDSNRYTLRLSVQWKGMLPDGKVGIASLEHLMAIRLLNDGSILVDHIMEHTRLPSLAPWTKILC